MHFCQHLLHFFLRDPGGHGYRLATSCCPPDSAGPASGQSGQENGSCRAHHASGNAHTGLRPLTQTPVISIRVSTGG